MQRAPATELICVATDFADETAALPAALSIGDYLFGFDSTQVPLILLEALDEPVWTGGDSSTESRTSCHEKQYRFAVGSS
jgi:hypothetical protein